MPEKVMCSEFRRKKLFFVFDKFFDVNGSGTIDVKDFDLAINKICGLRGWSVGDPKYAETKARFLEIWDALRKHADANKDEQVSREEWVGLWESEGSDWQKAYMNFMFTLQDTSGDGCLDVEEFTSVCSSFGVPAEEGRKGFETLSKNGKIIVDVDYYETLWKEFFFSDSPEALGNFIFGTTKFGG